MIYAVIDTNVLVSGLLTRNPEAATSRLLEILVTQTRITPLYNSEILNEYNEVLRREKFGFPEPFVRAIIQHIIDVGISSERLHSDEVFPDPNDIVFYEVALSVDGAFLVTGNVKHFPSKPIVVTPAEFLDILNASQ